jgi:hypothetical protein
MSNVSSHIATPEAVVSGVLRHLRGERFVEATTRFAEEFRFTDHGIGLEFKDRARLTEFFGKGREFYPDSSLITNRVFTSGDHVILEWTYRATITEPLYGGHSLKVPISVQGASVVQTHEGEISEWVNYYDGLKSGRTALAAYFKEWVEL